MYRELDYFEQLAALEHVGAFDFELIKLLLGRTLIDRWEMWKPSIDAMRGTGGYPMFEVARCEDEARHWLRWGGRSNRRVIVVTPG